MQKSLIKIGRSHPVLADQLRTRGGFLLDEMLPKLVEIDRLMPVLVRCNNGRFTCAVQDVKHFCTIIEEHAEFKAKAEGVELAGEWVRDISLVE